jgi:hypothetical protein
MPYLEQISLKRLDAFPTLAGFYNSAIATHLSKESSSILLQSAHVYSRKHENSTN